MQIKNKDYSVIKKNILKVLEFKGVSKKEFYEQSGVSDGILSQFGGLSEESLLKFINYYPEINLFWLLTGKGEMLVEDMAADFKPLNKLSKEKIIQSVVQEPNTLYNVKECDKCKEKDLLLKSKDDLIESQKELIQLLKNQICSLHALPMGESKAS